MSDAARDQVWRYSFHKGATFIVCLAVADVVNDTYGHEFFMHLDSLAQKTRLSVRSVSYALDELVKDGWLELIAQGQGRGNMKKYRWHFVEGLPLVFDTKRKHAKSASLKNMQSTTENMQSTTKSKVDTNLLLTERTEGENKPDGLQVKDLIKIYFDNFTGELEPSRGQLAGQLQAALKQIPFEKLKPLVIKVALDGQTISRNTLIYAQNQMQVKPVQATPTPPKFDPAEYDRPDAKPMPANFRDMIKGVEGVI